MSPKADDLGEQALNKMAQMAIASQLNEAKELEVQVKTNPSKLAQGELDSLDIAGEGLVMQDDLQMQEMVIHIDSVAVNPLKALFGNLQLTHPTQGTAQIVLTEADLNRAFNSSTLRGQMQDLEINLDGSLTRITVQEVTCHLPQAQQISIEATIQQHSNNNIQSVSFIATPEIHGDGRGVSLENVQYAQGKELSPQLTQALLAKAREILNLKNFEMEGIALRIQQLNITPGKITLQAIADVTQLPS